MALKRREFLLFLGASAGTMALGSIPAPQRRFSMPFMNPAAATTVSANGLSFKPIRAPLPLPTDGMTLTKQVQDYSEFEVKDDLVLPEGFTYNAIAAWGDKVGDSRFGYNNDYLSFVETGKDEGYLTVNHEYISSVPWNQTFEKVIGKSLPIADLEKPLKAAGKDGINAYALTESDPIKAKIKEISKEALIDQGLSVISIRKQADGSWVRTNSRADRRITGASGLDDGRYLKTTGPATAVFRKTQGQGYIDKLGDRIIGSFGNCAGGTTPWGTTLSAEENFQVQVPENVYGDGTSFSPDKRAFTIDAEEVAGQGNVFGLAGNKYGWVVEVDPSNPNDYGTKHTWLGRYRHEAVGVRAEAGKQLAFYSGCDRRSGHLYKFVSKGIVNNPKDKANSRLLTDGKLYAAKFNADGTGRWIALNPDTPVNPDLPSVHAGGAINLPKRPDGGYIKVEKDEDIAAFKQQYKTLGDLYTGNPEEKQGAILIDAHYAGNAAGATCTARPEDTDIAPDGSLYVTFTSGSPSSSEGGPDLRVFKGPDGKAYEFGWIVHLMEEGNKPEAIAFRWKMISLGGEPADGGAGFANPDNLLLDKGGNLWMVNDMSSDKNNIAVPKGRLDKEGKPISQSNLRGVFGNNAIWFIPTSGPKAGEAYMFGYGPMECETTGPFFTEDQQTLFLSIQHPGEVNGIRKANVAGYEDRVISLKTLSGEEFMQTRRVPIGSNWPGLKPNDPPKPAVVAIRRTDSQPI